MKITLLLLIAGFVQVSAATNAQNISLNVKNVSLAEVFTVLHDESGYNFLYDAELLDRTNKVTVSVNRATLTDVLDMCLKNQPVSYVITDKNVVITKKEQEPVNVPAANVRVTVTGIITNEAGAPLAGVTVTLKGTAISTSTNAKGIYNLSIPTDEGVLVFSSVGYQTVGEPLKGRAVINMQLKIQNTNLNDVVVVAYGTQKKVDLTGAVQQISGTDLQNRPVQDIGSALQGEMAGLNVTTTGAGGGPGASKAINIRGFTGLNGNLASPLILVDGVETDIMSVSPNDIESVTMLKDAASSALYGSRAPYGVLLIVTKHGKKDSPVTLTYSDNFSAAQPMGVPDEVNSLVFAETLNTGNENGGGGQLIPNDALARIKAYLADPSLPDNVPQPNNPENWSAYTVGFPNANTNWFKVFIKNWTQDQQHNLSLSGGSSKTTYFVGASTNVYNGTYNFINDSYTRDNLRANLTTEVNKYITFTMQTNFAQQINYGIDPYTQANWFQTMAFNWPINALIDPNGGYDLYSQAAIMANGGINRTVDDQYRVSGDITIKPLPGLTFTGHYNYDMELADQFIDALVTNYSTVSDPNTPYSLATSSLTKAYTKTTYYDYNWIGNYEHNFGYHYFKIQLGQETEQKSSDGIFGYNSALYSQETPSLSLASGLAWLLDNGYSWATNRTFGRFNYNYKDKYLLEANGAYMGSSLFSQSSRYAFFSSMSAGWNIAKEDFFNPLQKSISNLKLRASYGVSGDIESLLQSGSYYPSQAFLGTGAATSSTWAFSPTGARLPYVSPPGSFPSPTLTWQKPYVFDVGLDVDFLQDFSLSGDWYRRDIKDQLANGTVEYPATLYPSAPQINNAESVTKGWELTASWKHQYGDFALNARMNLSHYSGEVTKWPNNPNEEIGQPYPGEKLGTIWGFKTVGKFQTQQQVDNAPSQAALYAGKWGPGDIQYADLNNDGKIDFGNGTVSDPGDEEIIGNSVPKYFYSLLTGASWKGIFISVFLQGQGHADFAPPTGEGAFWGYTSYPFNSTITPKSLDYWTPTNTNAYFPRPVLGNDASQLPQTGYLLNLAYMRIKNLQVGYTIPDKYTQRLHIYGLKIYTSCENLATFSGVFAHQYYDPEILAAGTYSYPLQRTFSLGLNMNIK